MPRLRASVSAFCRRLGSARRQVCCEWIELLARGAAKNWLPSAVLALRETDLPVALWWPGETPYHPALWEGLAKLSETVILDSAARDTGEVRQIADRARADGASSFRSTVHDLAWIRLMPWRELTAQFFDPRAFRPLLGEIDTLEVWSALDTSHATTPYLWIAWMALRLGWEPIAETEASDTPAPGTGRSTSLRFKRPGGEGRARIMPPRQPNLPSGELEGVRLSVLSETSFTIQYDPSTGCATLTVSTPGACPVPRTVSLRHASTPALLATALDAPRPDPLYVPALHLAARLMP